MNIGKTTSAYIIELLENHPEFTIRYISNNETLGNIGLVGIAKAMQAEHYYKEERLWELHKLMRDDLGDSYYLSELVKQLNKYQFLDCCCNVLDEANI